MIRFQVSLWLLLILLSSMSHAQDYWEKIADCPEPRDRAISFSIDEYGYVGTGAGTNKMLNDLWRYDPKLNIWEEMAGMPTLGRINAICFVINSKAYVGLGFNENGLDDLEMWEYDPISNDWTQKKDFPYLFITISYFTTFSIGDKGYLKKSQDLTSNFVSYDPEKDEWTELASFPGEGLVEQVGFSVNGKGYLTLGFDGRASNPTEVWEYDPSNDQWTKKADFPGSPRNYGMSFTIGNRGYVGMGWKQPIGILTDFWEYTPETDSWLQIADCPLSSLFGSTFAIKEKGYYGAGLFSSRSEFWSYSPNSTDIETYQNNRNIVIYPNPSSDYIFINHNLDIIKVCIYSSHGKLVYEKKTNVKKLSIKSFPPGLYYFVVFHSRGTKSIPIIIL